MKHQMIRCQKYKIDGLLLSSRCMTIHRKLFISTWSCHSTVNCLYLHDSYISKFEFMNYLFAYLLVVWLYSYTLSVRVNGAVITNSHQRAILRSIKVAIKSSDFIQNFDQETLQSRTTLWRCLEENKEFKMSTCTL